MNIRELPEDRLATTDESGKRVYLYPADVAGKHRTRRSWVSAILIVIFLVLPWVRILGNPAILLDIPGRKFSVLGLRFWAHDAPMLFFIAAGAVVGLAFITAVWGRIWCGWACPQTVFVDSVFRVIERWIEGDSVKRKRLDQAPWSGEKVLLKALKWTVFTVLSLILGHSFLAYFVGTEELARMLASSPMENPASFLVMLAVSGGVLFDFGWFREQFCTVVCPYGRFQSVLMDDRSMVVAYDGARGEPRRGSSIPAGIPAGDCVNCYKCVAVCPTGIDIRRGLQLECIACTACIDVCDDVMRRTGKPEGLIRYSALSGDASGKPSLFRPRAMVYLAILMALATGLGLTVRGRKDFTADFVRAIGAPYEEVAGPSGVPLVINHFKVDLRNQGFSPLSIRLEISPEFKARGVELVMASQPPEIVAGQVLRTDIFLRVPKGIFIDGRAFVPIAMITPKDSIVQEVKLVGPLN